MNPMVSILAGYLAGLLLRDGKQLMKIEHVSADAPRTVTVRFASGLTLAVTVTEVQFGGQS